MLYQIFIRGILYVWLPQYTTYSPTTAITVYK